MGAGNPKTPGGRNPGVNRRSDGIDSGVTQKQGGVELFETNSTSAKMSFLSSNIEKMSGKYPLNKAGYFGDKGKHARVIRSENPIKTSEEFAGMLTAGMSREPINNFGGWKTITNDGTVIVYRPITKTPDSPAVDININYSNNPVLKGQKIHFEKRKK